MKAEDFKIGDKVMITEMPSLWNSWCNKNRPMNHCDIPYTFIIEDIQYTDSDVAMTCGYYGWSLTNLINEEKIIKISQLIKNKPMKEKIYYSPEFDFTGNRKVKLALRVNQDGLGFLGYSIRQDGDKKRQGLSNTIAKGRTQKNYLKAFDVRGIAPIMTGKIAKAIMEKSFKEYFLTSDIAKYINKQASKSEAAKEIASDFDINIKK